MNMTRTAVAAVSVAGAALSLGLVSGLSAPAGAATSTTAAPAAVAGRTPVVVSTCGIGGVPEIRPHQFGLSCDSSDFLVHLRWARWAVNDARGHGAESINDCVPDCAHGKFRSYPVRVSFWGTAAVKGHPGEVRYTRYKLTYTKTHPPGFGHTRTGTL